MVDDKIDQQTSHFWTEMIELQVVGQHNYVNNQIHFIQLPAEFWEEY
jgi:hypothetical protein